MTVVFTGAPFAGWVSSLAEVPDPVFAQGMMGDGVALDPIEGVVRAPADAQVIALAPTGHSVTLRLATGVELLIHVGIDTVALGGEGFTAKVAVGDRVLAGAPLIAFDLDLVGRRASSLVTPIIVLTPGTRLVPRALDRRVLAGEPLFELHGVVATSPTISAPASAANRMLVVPLAHGIHARPAARIVAALRPFEARVSMAAHGAKADARSTVGLMTLGVKRGDQIELSAQGADGEAAIAAIVALIDGGMGESTATPHAIAHAPPPGHPVCAAPGLAIGPVFQLQSGAIAVERDGAGQEIERARLATARAAAAAALGLVDIADAHRALIDDPELLTAAAATIDVGRSAGFAWRTAIGTQAERLRATRDARLIERVDDLIDIERQVLRALAGASATPEVPDGSILIAPVLLPSEFQAFGARLAGICTADGGPTSHVAILAAAAGVPMIVAAGPDVLQIFEGRTVVLDADAATLDADPSPERLTEARARITVAAVRRAAHERVAMADCRLADGTRIEVFANLASLAEAAPAVAAGAEGCGLLRTEFLFEGRETAPSVDEQHALYQGIADSLGGRPLIVRTLDIGGDKPVSYLPFPREDNPALGQRGIRLGLARPELLATQLRAVARVRPRGVCRIMVPMIVDVGELRRVRAALDAVCREEGGAAIQLGVMIETPAAAMLTDQLSAEADFLSIGTNDLTQYTLAADRGNPATAAMVDALHPAVLRLIARAGEAAIASFLSPDAAERQEAAMAKRLDRIGRALDRLERNDKVATEMMAMFVRSWLTSTPVLPEQATAAARNKGGERYAQFVEALGRRLASEISLAREISLDGATER